MAPRVLSLFWNSHRSPQKHRHNDGATGITFKPLGSPSESFVIVSGGGSMQLLSLLQNGSLALLQE